MISIRYEGRIFFKFVWFLILILKNNDAMESFNGGIRVRQYFMIVFIDRFMG